MLELAKFAAQFTPGAAGIWVLVAMGIGWFTREYRETRKLSDADKIELLRADLLASLRREAALAEQAERMKAERDAARKEASQAREEAAALGAGQHRQLHRPRQALQPQRH